jgi:hypothetical protein
MATQNHKVRIELTCIANLCWFSISRGIASPSLAFLEAIFPSSHYQERPVSWKNLET